MPTPRKDAVAKADKTSVAIKEHKFDDETLRGVTTLEDAMRIAAETYGGVDSIADFEIGNGFTVTDDKDRLVNRPLVILASSFHFGDFGEFVSLILMTMDTQDRIIINDGSTGICEQWRSVVKSAGRMGGITIPHGLRKSEYDTCPDCGKPQPKANATGDITECGSCGQDIGQRRGRGKTYYLDTSG